MLLRPCVGMELLLVPESTNQRKIPGVLPHPSWELLHFSSVTVHAEKSGWVVNTFNYGEWTITIPVFLEQKPVPSGRQCFSFLWIIPELFLQTAISSANLILSHENGNQPCCFLIHFCWELEQNGNISSLRSWQAQQQGSLLGMIT